MADSTPPPVQPDPVASVDAPPASPDRDEQVAQDRRLAELVSATGPGDRPGAGAEHRSLPHPHEPQFGDDAAAFENTTDAETPSMPPPAPVDTSAAMSTVPAGPYGLDAGAGAAGAVAATAAGTPVPGTAVPVGMVDMREQEYGSGEAAVPVETSVKTDLVAMQEMTVLGEGKKSGDGGADHAYAQPDLRGGASSTVGGGGLSPATKTALCVSAAVAGFVAATLLVVLLVWNAGYMLPYTAPLGTFAALTRFEVVDVYGPTYLRPNATGTFGLTLRNTGRTYWAAGAVTARFYSRSGLWREQTATVATAVAPGEIGQLLVTAQAIGVLGVATDLQWDVYIRHLGVASRVGSTQQSSMDVTCSDGVFCNGIERLVNGVCQTVIANPCDDSVACTTDECSESQGGLCSYTLGASCASCRNKACTPDCTGKTCGPNGCGGTCGTCNSTQACQSGVCVNAVSTGTCASPLRMFASNNDIAVAGALSLSGDTTGQQNQQVPSCNTDSDAPDQVWMFVVNRSMGIDAQSSGYDTVLELRRDACASGAAVSCADDSAPPGDYGSRVSAYLTPGTYYLVVDGYDSTQWGPYTLNVILRESCVPQCEGNYCGDDLCGGTCGTCATGYFCNSTTAACQQTSCTPSCLGKVCGDDGCGGSCGTCSGGQLCVAATGQCASFPTCHHNYPTCSPACQSYQFCGTDCACYNNSQALPDLVVNATRLLSDVSYEWKFISPRSCALRESCVGGVGWRRLLRFSVAVVNQGQADLTPALLVPEQRPDLFEYSPCHRHYHLSGFSDYQLRALNGSLVLTGHKQAYCMEDTVQALQGPNIWCEKTSDCSNQGIQVGWTDVYGASLDCQWLDITDVPPGTYRLHVEINPQRILNEMDYHNNAATVTVTVPAADLKPYTVPGYA